jgi:hypothetical protein
MLPGVLCLWTPPPYKGGLRRCRMPHDSGPRYATRKGSGAATRPAAPDPATLQGRASALPHVLWIGPASLQERAPTLPCVLWLQTPPSHGRGLWCHHVSGGPLRAIGHRNKERHTRMFPRLAHVVPRHARVVPRRACQSH